MGRTLSCNIGAIGCGVRFSEEPKGLAKGRSFRQIKALPRTPNGEMDSEKADAVIESQKRGERDIGYGFFKLRRRGQSAPVNVSEGDNHS